MAGPLRKRRAAWVPPPAAGVPRPAPNGSPQLRASRSDRERCASYLNAAYVVEQLDDDELSSRLNAALKAKTLGDLDALTADLNFATMDDRVPAVADAIAKQVVPAATRQPRRVGRVARIVATAAAVLVVAAAGGVAVWQSLADQAPVPAVAQGLDRAPAQDRAPARGDDTTPQVAGRITSGALSAPMPTGYSAYANLVVPGAYDAHVARPTWEGDEGSMGMVEYAHTFAVGRARVSGVPVDLEALAEANMEEWVRLYPSPTDSSVPTADDATHVVSGPVVVSGQPGWHVRWEVPYPAIPGGQETFDVIAVDLASGTDQVGLYWSNCALGDCGDPVRILTVG